MQALAVYSYMRQTDVALFAKLTCNTCSDVVCRINVDQRCQIYIFCVVWVLTVPKYIDIRLNVKQ
jgi:hypothetical protein